MANRVIEQLDEKIRQFEGWLVGLRTVRTMIAEDPAFVAILQELILNPESNGVLNPDRLTSAREPGLPTHERIREYLLSKGNEWHSLRAIAKGTQIPRNTVRGVLYQSVHSELFESRKTSNRNTLWRVKEEVPSPVESEDQPEEPPLATVPFGIGDKTTANPKRNDRSTGRKSKYGRS